MRLEIHPIQPGDTAGPDAVRELWRLYWQTLGLDLCFQNFAEELRTLPGLYSEPRGCLLLARVNGEPAGTAALRPLHEDACEAKRLFIHPDFRRAGLATALLTQLIDAARRRGYRNLYGDTLPSMTSALDLYRTLGFLETGPYSTTPTPGAIYLRLKLV